MVLTCNHYGLGVATQAIFEEPGEDGVSVGDVAVFAAAAGHGAGLTADRADLTFTQHAVNALTAAAHLRVLS